MAQNFTTFRVTFQVGQSRKYHTVYGVWAWDAKTDGSKRVWFYTNGKDGAHYVENVTKVISVCADESAFGETDARTLDLLH